jgi:hypothetical protein
LGLNVESSKFLDSSSGGSFVDLTLNEGRVILEKILANTPYTKIYDAFPKSPPEMQLEEPSIEIPEPKDVSASHTPTFIIAHITDTISEPIPKPFSDSCDSRVSSLSIFMTSFSMMLGMPQINPLWEDICLPKIKGTTHQISRNPNGKNNT